MADRIPPERAVRRYLMSSNGTVELHYQVSRGRKLLVYDALRRKDPPEFQRKDAEFTDDGRIIEQPLEEQEWRIIPTKDPFEGSLRTLVRDRLSDGAWHSLGELARMLAPHAATETQIKYARETYGVSYDFMPVQMQFFEGVLKTLKSALDDVGAERRGYRNGWNNEWRLPPGRLLGPVQYNREKNK